MRNHDVARRIAARLRELRESRQLSVRALGLRAGLGTEVVSRAERGLQTPSVQTLERLCQGLHVTLAEFFSEDGEAIATMTAGRSRRLEALLTRLDPSAQDLVLASLEGLISATTARFQNTAVPLQAAAERKSRYSARQRR